MRQLVAAAISKPADRTARHLGRLVRDARLARKMPQSELALRAKTSIPTLRRIEGGAPETSLGIWLAVMEQVGLLPRLAALDDPATRAMLAEHRPKRARRLAADGLDF